jgi:hypothetical protein
MESLTLTIALSELAQLGAVITGASSAAIEVRWMDGEKQFSEKVFFKEFEEETQHEQVFESGNCKITLAFKKNITALDSGQRRALDLIASQVLRQVQAKQAYLETQRRVTQAAKMSALGL